MVCEHGNVFACCSACGPSDEDHVLDQVVAVDGKRLTVNNVYTFAPGQILDVHGDAPDFPLLGLVSVVRTGTTQEDGRLDNYETNIIEVSGALRITAGDVLVVHNPRNPAYLRHFPDRLEKEITNA